ncbi:MAG: hypothetical protein WD993_02400 [Thermoleophilaceae bacterium]
MRVRLALAIATVACLGAPAVAGAGEPIMKLADVRSDMSCTALSVLRGTAVSRFDIEVIDVLRGEAAAYGPRILFRASGPAIDATGIGPGFSGSPIYCRDDAGVERVAGAISEGIGQYGNKVALATPIEEVLGVRALPPPRARTASALLRSARPLSTPLTVGGLSGPVRRAAVTAARRAGTPLLAAPAGPATGHAPYELAPGTSVAAGLSSGDITISAIGTVTYRDGDRLWAFGHPLDGYGRRALPLLDAYVFTIVDNPLGTFEGMTYKLASAGRPVGILTNDGIGAIAGRIGTPPPTIPLVISAHDLASGRRRTLRARVADERRLDRPTGLGLAGMFGLGEAMTSVLGAEPPNLAASMCVRAHVRQAPRPLRFCKRYFSQWGMIGDLSTALGLLDGYRFGPLGIRRVAVRTQLRAGARDAFIVRGKAPRRVEPDQRIRVRLRLQRSRAGRFGVSFPYRVPRSAKPGRRTLTVRGTGPGDGGGLLQLFQLLFGVSGDSPSRSPRSIGELATRFAHLGRPDGVRATLAPKGAGRIVYRTKSVRIRGRTQIPLIVRRDR